MYIHVPVVAINVKKKVQVTDLVPGASKVGASFSASFNYGKGEGRLYIS